MSWVKIGLIIRPTSAITKIVLVQQNGGGWALQVHFADPAATSGSTYAQTPSVATKDEVLETARQVMVGAYWDGT
ncbi:hypothetical protein [Nonomuraea gerenzanensis]|uniref:hypothetical protein n=1 Tax=Nonomuraea gerenzanensis TaxID=93944 RepID=UPI001CDA3ECC|nr:hypothetical protein [Nonomuraea gerenzanensis]UBU16670.1 hypothetical protein LCN96_17125 [Nonomuraea gerenzanensis]